MGWDRGFPNHFAKRCRVHHLKRRMPCGERGGMVLYLAILDSRDVGSLGISCGGVLEFVGRIEASLGQQVSLCEKLVWRMYACVANVCLCGEYLPVWRISML